jgi:hypothetical protein
MKRLILEASPFRKSGLLVRLAVIIIGTGHMIKTIHRKEAFMRYLVLLISGVLLLSADMLSAQESAVDFTGEWALNEDKSDLGGGPGGRRRGMRASKMFVEQKENKLVVEAFRTNRAGEEMSNVSTYTLDGKECTNSNAFMTSVSVAEWSEDGKTLTISSTITFSRSGREFTMESTAIWSLAENTLAIETTRTSSRGERKSKAVYDKS